MPNGGSIGDADIAILEGNYLLLDEGDWAGLAGRFDLTVFLDVPRAELEQRLMARWLGLGLGVEDARTKTYENDLPNGLRVIENSVAADFVVKSWSEDA